MLPKLDTEELQADFEEELEPSKTYKLNTEKGRFFGYADELEAVEQAIFLMLSIERYDYPIYSWNYGFESKDLIGKPAVYVASVVPGRIQDCLLQDERILKVDSFQVTINKKSVHVRFTVHTIFGELNMEKEVDY